MKGGLAKQETATPIWARLSPWAKIPNSNAVPIKGRGRAQDLTSANSLPLEWVREPLLVSSIILQFFWSISQTQMNTGSHSCWKQLIKLWKLFIQCSLNQDLSENFESQELLALKWEVLDTTVKQQYYWPGLAQGFEDASRYLRKSWQRTLTKWGISAPVCG